MYNIWDLTCCTVQTGLDRQADACQQWLLWCITLISGTVGQLQMINGGRLGHSTLVLIKDSNSTVWGTKVLVSECVCVLGGKSKINSMAYLLRSSAFAIMISGLETCIFASNLFACLLMKAASCILTPFGAPLLHICRNDHEWCGQYGVLTGRDGNWWDFINISVITSSLAIPLYIPDQFEVRRPTQVFTSNTVSSSELSEHSKISALHVNMLK